MDMIHTSSYAQVIRSEGGNRDDIWRKNTGSKKDGVTLQEGETVAYKWVSRKELVSMKKSELLTERMQTFIKELQ